MNRRHELKKVLGQVLGSVNGQVTEAGSMLPIMKSIIVGWKKEQKDSLERKISTE